jgi:hypothetical protein
MNKTPISTNRIFGLGADDQRFGALHLFCGVARCLVNTKNNIKLWEKQYESYGTDI